MKIFKHLLVGTLGLIIFLSTPSLITAASVRVVSFNTQQGTPRGNCSDPGDMIPAKHAKIEALATYIVQQRPDIALLQEIVTNCDLAEEEMLAQKLAEKGYPMEYYIQQERKGHMNTVTFSRLPILRDQVEEIIDMPEEPARSFIMVPVQHPGGTVLYTYNAHIRASEPQRCPGVETLYRAALQRKNDATIVGGDFNLTMTLNPDDYTCPESLRAQFTTDFDFFGFHIDFLAIPKGGPLTYTEKFVDPNSPISDHKAVWATFEVPELSCKIQGYKRYANTEPTPVRVVVDGNTNLPTTTNPYFVDVDPGTHTVSVSPPTGTTPGYTLCYNRTTCHEQTPTPGVSVDVTCDGGGYIDLWWHFTGVAEPTPPPPTPPPTPPTCQNNPDINRNGSVDIFDYNLLVTNFGRPVTNSNRAADINCNNAIDIFDYNTLVTAFGN